MTLKKKPSANMRSAINAAPFTQDVVLVGGGHSHVRVMTAFAMQRPKGVRLTLVTETLDTPYSGMLPGYIAGVYSRDAMHIDLSRLARATGVRLIFSRATGLDIAARRLTLEGRPPLDFDFLSLNLGITPDLSAIAGAELGVAVKPINHFIRKFERALAEALRPDGPRRFAVVGGGAAGVELICALRARLARDAPLHGLSAESFSFQLLSSGLLVPAYSAHARKKIERRLARLGIAILPFFRVAAISKTGATADDGRVVHAEKIFFSTAARAPHWLEQAGLQLGAFGAVATDDTLRALGQENIFATGDCATIVGASREKAGVFAVRQGPILARNLFAACAKKPLRHFVPQKRFLTLLATGDGSAIATRGKIFAAEGPLVWRWKDHIDRRFMAMFSDFGADDARPARALDLDSGEAMRCAGCAAKVGPAPLEQALARLPQAPEPENALLVGLDARDDAAVIALTPECAQIETIDHISAIVADPYVFGEIAALHAMNDILAMGGKPTRALALAQAPFSAPKIVSSDLFQMLAGARRALDAHGVALIGGHTGESEKLALGFAVTGSVHPKNLIRKNGLRAGDRLLLTKPLGVGLIMAADARGAAPARVTQGAIEAMRRSNFVAAELAAPMARAMTDITGFGLVGHLLEMLRGGDFFARLDLSAIPLLPGALALAERGFQSSLTGQNAILADAIACPRPLAAFEQALLFDPQTSGPLLIAAPAHMAEDSLALLHKAGFGDAREIGVIAPKTPIPAPPVKIIVDGVFSP